MTPLLVVWRIWLIRAAHYIASRLPLRDRLVLATSHKDRLDGSLACIRAEAAQRQPPIPTIALTHRPTAGLAGLLRTAIYELRAAYYLATSRVFVVDDYFLPLYVIRRRPSTRVIMTGHALGPSKRWGYGVSDRPFGAHPSLLKRVRIHSNYDFCLLGSKSAAPSYAEATRQPPDRFVTHLGIPRTDLLFPHDDIAHLQERIRRRYSVPAGRRVVLYAPTFRGQSVIGARGPDTLDLAHLQRVLGDDHVLLVRQHPFVRESVPLDPALDGFVVDVSDYPEINELLLLADVLLTDYSTAIYEFAILGKPIVIFAPDYDEMAHERGFFLDYRNDSPGPVLETTAEVAGYLRAGAFDLERVGRFRQRWVEIADGKSSQRVVDELIRPALAGGGGR